MPRIPRSITLLPGFAVHKIWRGHNREWNLETNEQKQKYLDILNEELESKQVGAVFNALTLMSSHTHEIPNIELPILFSKHMRRHHSRYGMFFNKLMNRCGKVAQDRPKTCLIADEEHQMKTTFYIHANPVRAGIVRDAKDYYWSTHKLYAFGKRELWMRNIKLPGWYMKLGRTSEQRQSKYRKLFAGYLMATGNRKQLFHQRLFFGPTVWVGEREMVVAEWRAAHAPP